MNKKSYSSLYLNSNLKAADIFATALTVVLMLASLVAPFVFFPWGFVLWALEMIPPFVVGTSLDLNRNQRIAAILLGILSTPIWIAVLVTNFIFLEGRDL